MGKSFIIIICLLGMLSSHAQKRKVIDLPDQKGTVLKKEKVGIWKFYENGKLVLEYDYDADRVIFQQSFEDKSYYVKGQQWYPVAKLEVYPRYKGSYIQFYQTIYKHVQYPQEAQNKGIEGTSFLSFEVDEQGNAINPEVHHDLGYGCSREMMRVFNKVRDHWIPAVKDGKALRTKFVIPFIFSFFETPYILTMTDDLPSAALLDGVNVTLISSKFN